MKKANRRKEEQVTQSSAEILLQGAGRILSKTNAAAIMVYVDSLPEINAIKCLAENIPVILATREHKLDLKKYPGVIAKINVPAFSFTRFDQIKIATVIGLANGVLKQGQKIICLTGIAGSGKIDTLMIIEIGTELEMFGGQAADFFATDVAPEVLIRIINISARLSLEGREGKPVGTCFIIGDHEKVQSYSRQMALNPFKGYPEEERSILHPGLEETIKEFAAIDGAYIIRGDGIIMNAAAYLQPPGSEKPLEPGLGARHAAAAAITETTKALAIVLSESTGMVRLYKDGIAIMAIERPTGHA